MRQNRETTTALTTQKVLDFMEVKKKKQLQITNDEF